MEYKYELNKAELEAIRTSLHDEPGLEWKVNRWLEIIAGTGGVICDDNRPVGFPPDIDPYRQEIYRLEIADDLDVWYKVLRYDCVEHVALGCPYDR
jgi:hypothetical protein